MDIDLLTIKVRLLISSVEKATEMGINWWETDKFLSSKADGAEREKKIEKLEDKVKRLENKA